MRRLDHAAIFLLIAGTYTPICLLTPLAGARTLLAVIWAGAAAGIVFAVLWPRAPKWLNAIVYVALGWVAVFYFGPLLQRGGVELVAFQAQARQGCGALSLL